jgi:hypothetical protein
MARDQGISKRAPRIDLRRPAVMIDSDGREHDVTILDVSSGGFRLQVPESPRIGEFVTLRVERGEEFTAQIRWALGTKAGGVFLTGVGSDILDAHSGEEEDDRRKGDRRETPDRRESNRPEPDRREGDRRT